MTDMMQVAGHLSLEFGATVEGPFTEAETTVVRVWLPNKRGISLAHKEGRDADGVAELAVIRESVPDMDTRDSADGVPWRVDYSTPVTTDADSPAVRVTGMVPGTDLDGAREALRVLRDLPEIDPRDQRPTDRLWSAVHYGENHPACGGALRNNDECTTDLKQVRCLDCLEEVNRSV